MWLHFVASPESVMGAGERSIPQDDPAHREKEMSVESSLTLAQIWKKAGKGA